MKQLSHQMGDGHNVQQLVKKKIPLSIIQAIFYACLGGFSIQEVLEARRV